ncbi:MAG: hypothetical protein S4CHLAM20_04950 [Chlamydiia bacterium]|nr:hypothetical protein [Chlamydiia bacterium]
MENSRPTTPINLIQNGPPNFPPPFKYQSQIEKVNRTFQNLSQEKLAVISSFVKLYPLVQTYTLEKKPFNEWSENTKFYHNVLAQMFFKTTGFPDNMYGSTINTMKGIATVIIRFLDSTPT